MLIVPRGYAQGRAGRTTSYRNWQAYCGKLTADSTHFGFLQSPFPDFSHVRFLLRNHIISGPPTLTRLLAAVTNTAANKITPSVGGTVTGNGATGFVEATWDGDPNPTLSPVIDTIVSGVADVAYNGGYDWSDIMPLRSIRPIDGLGNGNPYLMWRDYIPPPYTWWPLSNNSTDQSRPDFLQVFVKSGDHVTNPTTATSVNVDSSSRTNIAGIEFFRAGIGENNLRILGVGDSLTQGYASSTAFRSWGFNMEKVLNNLGIPANFINGGWVGTTTATYGAFNRASIDEFNPNIVLYSAYSPNNTPIDQASFNTQWNDLLEFDNFCKSRGVQCIFTFIVPDNFFNLTQDNFRKAYIQKVKAAFPDRTFDVTPWLGDGGSPEKYIPAYHSGDNIHPNDSGYDLAGEKMALLLKDFLAANVV
jgi:lysophospholipase L1-like esterase